jgi:acetyl esterase
MSEFDPAIARWLRQRATDPTAADASVAGLRAHNRAVATKALAQLADPPLPASEHDMPLPGRQEIPLRIFLPPGDPATTTIVYFHGGGWVACDLDTHLQHARRLCTGLPARVISVGYRLAPEHAFPAAFDDCLAVARWVAEQGSPSVVAGDSAGAQLAASVAIACRDEQIPLAAQLLIVPATDVRGSYQHPEVNALYPSRAVNADGYGLTLLGMVQFAALYQAAGDDWRVSPIAADLSDVAPAVVHTAGYDVLRDEGHAYARALQASGVAVTERNWATLNHGYFTLGGVSPTAELAASQAVSDLHDLVLQP